MTEIHAVLTLEDKRADIEAAMANHERRLDRERDGPRARALVWRRGAA